MQFIPLVVIMVAMWALLIVPQQRRTKAHRAMLTALDVGDEVLTSAGFYGTIAEFDGDTVFLAVNDALEITLTKASTSACVPYPDAA